MKTTRRLILAALSAAVLGLAACGGDDADDGSGSSEGESGATEAVAEVPFEGSPENGLPTSYPEPEPEDLTIGLLNPRRASEVLANMFDAAKEQVEELGGESIELDAEQDPDLQVSQFEQLINQEVDAIVAFPIAEPKLIRPVLEKAGKAGIPVVGIDITPGETDPVPGFASQVSRAHDETSYLQVKAAAEALGPGAKVAEVNFALPVPLFEYTEARRAHWAEQFGLEIVDSVENPVDTIDSAQEVSAGMIAANPDIEGVLGYVEEAAIGAQLAAREAGREDLQTFGRNGTSVGISAIESGRLTATAFQNFGDAGREVVKAAYDAVQGVEIPPVVLADKPFLLTEDNLDEVPE